MPRFAANLSWLYTELPFPQRFEAAARDGFKGVEIMSPYAWPAAELKAMLQVNGLQLVLINSPPGGFEAAGIERAWVASRKGTACLAGHEAEFRAGFALALGYAEALGCPSIHAMAGVLPEGVQREAVQGVYVGNLRHAAQAAAQAGVQVLIEPINTRDIPRYFLNRQDHAHEIIDQAGAANLKVQLDLYHCQVVEGDLTMTLRRDVPTGRIGHIQIAGAPGRHEPDVGEINYPCLFSLLDELGYGGWVGCEYRPARGLAPSATPDGLGWLAQARRAMPQR
ncbi:MAG: Hydroxypyruvate isomerase [Polaromonas sp.]|nr:Hydroxypyruvate isomerase [Polaromonas sp.]